MSGQHTSLSSELRNKIEIILLVRVFIFNDLGVNNASRRRVDQCSLTIVHEESLSDSLVDNDHSEAWLLGRFVIHFIDRLSKLRNLLL